MSAVLPQHLPGPRRKRRIALFASAAIVALALLFAVAASVVTPYDPGELDLYRVAELPSVQHPLGTDQLGRDVLSRLIAGARAPLLGAFLIALGVAIFGSLLGVPAGYFGGFLDTFLMRWTDLMIALPSLLVAIVIVSVVGVSFGLSVAILTLFTIPYEVRMMRGLAMEQRALPYVEAAQSAGLGHGLIMVRHIWPNTLRVLVADTSLNFAFGLIGLSTLSFLGLGAPLGVPDWGRMLFESKELLFDNPVAAIAPALAISLTAAAAAILGDSGFERFTDGERER